jgi:tetratricopeptide (TPR) repeat protein
MIAPEPQPVPADQFTQVPLEPVQQQFVEPPAQLIVTEEEKSVANDLLLTPVQPRAQETREEPKVEVDLAKAALDATAMIEASSQGTVVSSSISNQDISWYNQGVQLIEDGKYREALSSFDRALPSFANDNEMVIRILNGRGNAFYFMEKYPACVESYHKAMMIDPSNVRGQTLYNMGTAYAEMERFPDAIKCYEQAMPRGLSPEETSRAKEQIRRCTILEKERKKKLSRN